MDGAATRCRPQNKVTGGGVFGRRSLPSCSVVRRQSGEGIIYSTIPAALAVAGADQGGDQSRPLMHRGWDSSDHDRVQFF